LRSANLSQESFLWNSNLLLVVGIAVIVLSVFVFSDQSRPAGSIMFHAVQPKPNIYTYVIGSKSATPLFEEKMPVNPISPEKGYFIDSTVSKNQKQILLVFKKGPLNTLSIFSPESGKTETVKEGIDGDVSVALSQDGTHLAYSTLSLREHARASTITVPIRNISNALTTATTTQWAYLTITQLGATNATTEYPIAGTPIGFSPDARTLLIKSFGFIPNKSFALITFKEPKKFQYISGMPAESAAAAALSQDGKYLALAMRDTIEVGSIDWERAIFTRIAQMPQSAKELVFGEQNILGAYIPGKVSLYTVTDSGVSEKGSFPIEIKELTSLLGVHLQ
jgi:hypothetical protein